jgi:hypothetical protein
MNPENLIRYFKNLINENNTECFISDMNELTQDSKEINVFGTNADCAYTFQKLYLHACLKKRKEIADYLTNEIYPKLYEIERLSIKQVFPYGRYLLSK